MIVAAARGRRRSGTRGDAFCVGAVELPAPVPGGGVGQWNSTVRLGATVAGAHTLVAGGVRRVLLWTVRFYRVLVSPRKPLGAYCRMIPSCSSYAESVLIQQPLFRAFGLIARRLCRCHPWGREVYDPPPQPLVIPTPTPLR